MQEQEKKHIHEQSTQEMHQAIQQIKARQELLNSRKKKHTKELHILQKNDKRIQELLLQETEKQLHQLKELTSSPYIARCTVSFSNAIHETICIGKYACTEAQIYSWVSPIAALRFKSPGKVMYERPDGTFRRGMLETQQHYMIRNQRIVYETYASLAQEKTLIYQSYFSEQERTFALPEIIAQMEEAQDQVIRAHHRGPLVISGPAGSGKTTLAFHRMAYLMQAPGVSDHFAPKKSIVFVPDKQTITYFSSLLPELGIHDVNITTFADFCLEVLELKEGTYQSTIRTDQYEHYAYTYQKIEALRAGTIEYDINPWNTLKNAYNAVFDPEMMQWFEEQKNYKQFDRIDLTILLYAFKKHHGTITQMQTYYVLQKQGAAKKKQGRFPCQYDLMILDEFQNYLPEQIALLRPLIKQETQAMMYIGDLAQQTQLGTIRSWKEIGEDIPETRHVHLHKVYRNTKEILRYIAHRGYSIDISPQLPEGKPVITKQIAYQHLNTYIQDHITAHGSQHIGLLFEEKHLAEHVAHLSSTQIHILSMTESQGLEFDIVYIFASPATKKNQKRSPKFEEALQHIKKDMWYVAMTRAMKELIIVELT